MKTQRDLMAIAINRATGLPDDKRFQESEALIESILKENGLALTADDFPPDSLTAGAFTNMMRQVREADSAKEKAWARVRELETKLEDRTAEIARLTEAAVAQPAIALPGDPVAEVTRLRSELERIADSHGTVTLALRRALPNRDL